MCKHNGKCWKTQNQFGLVNVWNNWDGMPNFSIGQGTQLNWENGNNHGDPRNHVFTFCHHGIKTHEVSIVNETCVNPNGNGSCDDHGYRSILLADDGDNGFGWGVFPTIWVNNRAVFIYSQPGVFQQSRRKVAPHFQGGNISEAKLRSHIYVLFMKLRTYIVRKTEEAIHFGALATSSG